MAIPLGDLLESLHEDHRNMALVLDLLERQTDSVRRGDAPDYGLLQDIMQYLIVYSDAVHHPKEDLLYSSMRTEKPDLAAGLERVGPEHKQLAERGQLLRDDIAAIASGAPVTRERLLDDARDYVHTLRKHMAWEEEDLFRRAQQMFSEEDAIDVSEVDTVDPAFGPQREHAFANLLQHITN